MKDWKAVWTSPRSISSRWRLLLWNPGWSTQTQTPPPAAPSTTSDATSERQWYPHNYLFRRTSWYLWSICRGFGGLTPLKIADPPLTRLEGGSRCWITFVSVHSTLSISDHISPVSKSCFLSIRDLSRIRNTLDYTTAHTIATFLIHSKFDYCNSLFLNL